MRVVRVRAQTSDSTSCPSSTLERCAISKQHARVHTHTSAPCLCAQTNYVRQYRIFATNSDNVYR